MRRLLILLPLLCCLTAEAQLPELPKAFKTPEYTGGYPMPPEAVLKPKVKHEFGEGVEIIDDTRWKKPEVSPTIKPTDSREHPWFSEIATVACAVWGPICMAIGFRMGSKRA